MRVYGSLGSVSLFSTTIQARTVPPKLAHNVVYLVHYI